MCLCVYIHIYTYVYVCVNSLDEVLYISVGCSGFHQHLRDWLKSAFFCLTEISEDTNSQGQTLFCYNKENREKKSLASNELILDLI